MTVMQNDQFPVFSGNQLMEIHISLQGRQHLMRQIYQQLRAAILDGRLPAGQRLPSSRELAGQLAVSRKTVLDAFERLAAEGWLQARAGDGTFVADSLVRVPPPRAVAHQTASLSMALPHGEPLALDFRGGVTDKRLFPFDHWRRCSHKALRELAHGYSGYRDPAGEPALREAIAGYLAFSRAVSCDWQDMLVTQGAQQAIDLLARVWLRPGDVVAVEEPGYPPVRACLAAQGARVVAVPVDADGLRVDLLPADAKLVYVTPSHQFPLGMPMSLERRLGLLHWARTRGALIVEDDYDGEFRFASRPIDALHSLDASGTVAYVGSFSKTLFPELRAGYVVPPPVLVPALREIRQRSDWHGCTLTQLTLAAFMKDGGFARHLRRMRRHYAARRQVLLSRLSGDLAFCCTPQAPAAGMHLIAWLAPGRGEAALIADAAQHALGLHGLAGFFAEPGRRPGLLFGYGALAVDEIHTACDVLARVAGRRNPILRT